MKIKLEKLNKKQNSFKDCKRSQSKSKKKDKKCLNPKLLQKLIQKVDMNRTLIVPKSWTLIMMNP